MDATLFQDVYNAIDQNNKKLLLNVENGSPITKIIWSSFDYMVGPEMQFVWEPHYQKEYCLFNQSQMDESVSDQITSSSSKETQEGLNGLQYDDNMHENLVAKNWDEQVSNTSCPVSSTNVYNFVKNDTSTLCATSDGQTTITAEQDNGEDKYTDEERSSYTNLSEPDNDEECEKNSSPGRGCDSKNTSLITSCVDSGIAGTISVHSDLSGRSSKLRNNVPNGPQQNVIDELCSTDGSDYGCCADDQRKELLDATPTDEVDNKHLLQCLDKSATASFLNASSNVVGMSMLGTQLDDVKSSRDEKESTSFASLVENDRVMGRNLSQVSEDEFVANFVLAEQICSIQFDSNPMVTKISVVPNRRLMIVSYLFAVKNNFKSMMAFSVVMNENAEEWFYAREQTFEKMFTDIVPRFKATLLIEQDIYEIICLLTENFLEIFNLWGMLVKEPLLSHSDVLKPNLNVTHFVDQIWTERNLSFLYKSVTACLMCQGTCVVIGNNTEEVKKQMHTLAMFLSPARRLLCLKAHTFHFSPYLQIQGLRRDETEDLYMSAVETHWPICFIDIDKLSVTYSGNYFEHRQRKELLQLQNLAQIIKEHKPMLQLKEQLNLRSELSIVPIPVEIDPYIKMVLDAFFLLTTDRSSFLQHVLMSLEYKARALIEITCKMSEPSNTFKDSAISAKWSLSTVRRILNIELASSFGMVLAQAQQLNHSFAEFLYQHNRTS